MEDSSKDVKPAIPRPPFPTYAQQQQQQQQPLTMETAGNDEENEEENGKNEENKETVGTPSQALPEKEEKEQSMNDELLEPKKEDKSKDGKDKNIQQNKYEKKVANDDENHSSPIKVIKQEEGDVDMDATNEMDKDELLLNTETLIKPNKLNNENCDAAIIDGSNTTTSKASLSLKLEESSLQAIKHEDEAVPMETDANET